MMKPYKWHNREEEREMEGKEKDRVSLGKSILVPSVQELAKQSLSTVPDRYVRQDQIDSNHEGCDHFSLDFQLPIISMQRLLSRDEMELRRLHSVCKEWGFFQLIDHGISTTLIEKFKVDTQDFFNIPMEEKKKYWQTACDIEGFGQSFVVSDEQKLDWGDMFYLTTLPKFQRKPNLLPMLPHPYRESLENYSDELHKLAKNIIDCMAKNLNIDVEEMRSVFGEGNLSIRTNYYPPCPQPEKVFGLNAHSDAAALAILLHVNEVGGLQISKDGKWFSVKPLPNAFIINNGDVLEIVSNGEYPSVMHRALVNEYKERLTVVTFYTATVDREIGPIPSLITPNNPAKFRKIGMVDYWRGFIEKTLDGKSYLDAMKVDEN